MCIYISRGSGHTRDYWSGLCNDCAFVNAKSPEKTYVVQLHKAYNELSQASVQYLTDNNAINLNEAGLTDINAFDDFMNNYFKIVKACGKIGQIVLVQNTKIRWQFN